jgi:hypothetical protein
MAKLLEKIGARLKQIEDKIGETKTSTLSSVRSDIEQLYTLIQSSRDQLEGLVLSAVQSERTAREKSLTKAIASLEKRINSLKLQKGDKGEQGAQGEPGQDGKDGVIDTATIAYLENLTLDGDAKLQKDIDDLETKVDSINTRPSGFGSGAIVGADNVTRAMQHGITITYNTDGTVDTVTTPSGVRRMVYTSGVLTSLVGSGSYYNKTFTYTDGALTNVTIQ